MNKHIPAVLLISVTLMSCSQTRPAESASGRPLDAAVPQNEIATLTSQGQAIKYVANQIIVKDGRDGKLEKWLAKHGARIVDNGLIPEAPASVPRSEVRPVVNDYRLVEITAATQVAPALTVQKLQGLTFGSEAAKQTFLTGLSLAEEGIENNLNYSMEPTLVANDVEGATSGSYLTTPSFWHLASFPGSNSHTLFDRGYTGAGVDIAIIDTGFHSQDYDVSNSDPVNPNRPFRGLQSYDFVANSYVLPNTPDQAPNGVRWHGLHVARVALGSMGNHAAGVGAAPQARPMFFRLSTSYSYWDAARAVNTAVAWGADVINMSFGGWANAGWDGGSNFGSALANATNNKVVNVASAGNNGAYSSKETVFGNVYIPAAWNNVIGVGAINSVGSRATFSNYGPIADVWAGGDFVGHSPSPDLSCWATAQCTALNNGLFGQYGVSGTSFSAPVVAGVAALMKQANPAHTVYSVKQTIQSTVNKSKGDWILDAGAAVRKTVIDKGGTW